MTELAAHVEIAKLARELQVEKDSLSFLTTRSAAELRELRVLISDALFSRNEPRLLRVAALSGLLPTAVTTKLAELTFGPFLAARVAAVMRPAEAVKLATHLTPSFLAELAVALDPKRAEPILRELPKSLVIDVGHRLLELNEYITLGRFVSVIDLEAVIGVVERSNGSDLLNVARYTEDPSCLDPIVARLDDDVLSGVLTAAHKEQAYDDLVSLLSVLSTHNAIRLIRLADRLDVSGRRELAAAIVRNDAWDSILPSVASVEHEILTRLVNVPETLSTEVMDRVITVAKEMDQAYALVHLVLALDDAHLKVLETSSRLSVRTTRKWLLDRAGVSKRLVQAVLNELGF